jgi:hypothetical protein
MRGDSHQNHLVPESVEHFQATRSDRSCRSEDGDPFHAVFQLRVATPQVSYLPVLCRNAPTTAEGSPTRPFLTSGWWR